MSAQIFTDGNFQGMGTDGKVVPYGKLYIYNNATGALVTTWQDSAQTITNTNPVILSAVGKARVFLAGGTYDLVLHDANDAVVWTLDAYTNDQSKSHIGTIAELRTTTYTGQAAVSVLGYYTASDNIGVREYYWDAASTEADNGGTIIQVTGVVTGRWKMKYSWAVNVKWFGAVGDGIANDSTPVDNWLAVGGFLEAAPGTYSIGGKSFTVLSGTFIDGRGATFDLFGTTNGFVVSSCTSVVIRDLNFTNVTPSITQGIRLEGVNSNIHISNVTTNGLYQFALEVTGSFDGLYIDNFRVYNHGRPAVGVSSGIEINPTAVSYRLSYTNCSVEVPSANGGNCSKVQNVSIAVITGNTFERGTGGAPSLSQAVMLGTSGKPLQNFIFEDNNISDGTTTMSALYVGGGSSDGLVSNNIIKDTDLGGRIYLGTLTNVALEGNKAFDIATIGTPNLTGVSIEHNKVQGIRFDNSIPVDVSKLVVQHNTVNGRLRVDASGITSYNKVKDNTNHLLDTQESWWYLSNCIYDNNTITAEGTGTNAVVGKGTGIVITKNTWELGGTRSYGLYANGLTGNIHMNSFYGHNLAYKTDIGGAPVYFHNNVAGVIV